MKYLMTYSSRCFGLHKRSSAPAGWNKGGSLAQADPAPPAPLQASAQKSAAEKAAQLAAKDRDAAEKEAAKVAQVQSAAEERARLQEGES